MRNVLFFRGTSNVRRQRRAKRVRCTPGLGPDKGWVKAGEQLDPVR